jgi:hypothetical protein
MFDLVPIRIEVEGRAVFVIVTLDALLFSVIGGSRGHVGYMQRRWAMTVFASDIQSLR